jgi:hypothetical protein
VPAPTAPLFGFALGALLAWVAAADLARSTTGYGTQSFLLVVGFALLVFAPVSAYFVAFEPDWSLAYLIDSERLPSVVPMTLVLAAAASVPAGFIAAAADARTHRQGRVLWIALPPLLAAVGFVVAMLSRLAVQANYAQFHGDFGTRGVAGSPLGYALLWMLSVLCLATIFTTRALQRLCKDS